MIISNLRGFQKWLEVIIILRVIIKQKREGNENRIYINYSEFEEESRENIFGFISRSSKKLNEGRRKYCQKLFQ